MIILALLPDDTHRVPCILDILYRDVLRFMWKEKLVKDG